MLGVTLAGVFGLAASVEARAIDFCSQVARAQHRACRHDAIDNSFTQKAVCINTSDAAERSQCFADRKATHEEDRQLCSEQFDARKDVCAALGEDRYAPDFNPAGFDDDFTNLSNPNPYFPLAIGNRWEYVSGGETDTVEVLDKTKLIEGVTCIVTSDVVDANGTQENTQDWFGQKQDGTVFYCGESVKELETFPGDVPAELELVDVEGSWKAGRDGAKPGIIFLASPSVGLTYRQEWLPGTAEDIATVLSTTYGFGTNPELDVLVPQSLATLLCTNDCVVTRDTSPLEPDVVEIKYYSPGIGLFLEVTPDTGEVSQLTDCNFDPRCALLP
jgi:hypothetical protein